MMLSKQRLVVLIYLVKT